MFYFLWGGRANMSNKPDRSNVAYAAYLTYRAYWFIRVSCRLFVVDLVQ